MTEDETDRLCRTELAETLEYVEAETRTAQGEMLALETRLKALMSARDGLRTLLDLTTVAEESA